MGKLRVYCLKTLNKPSIYPLGNTPSAPSVFLTRVVTDDTMTKGSALIEIKMVAGELATSYTTDCVDEVVMIEIFKPVLIRVMSVGAMVKVHRRRVFPTLLVTSVLEKRSVHVQHRAVKNLRDIPPC